MMTTIPGCIVRVLDDLGPSHLAGDLAEELHNGRSSTWVWWQVSAAVARGVAMTVLRYPYVAFKAMAVGWVVLRS
jgi:hypothetical protein